MAGHEATASILQTLFGQKQLGGLAPTPDLQGGMLNFNPMDFQQGGGFNPLSFLLQQGSSSVPPSEPIGQQLSPPEGSPGFVGPPQGFTGPAEGSPGFVGPPNVVEGNQQGLFANFFGNLDQNLQSPSKVLGLGLLNQIDPRLAGAGLFAGGLFGKNKLFGGN